MAKAKPSGTRTRRAMADQLAMTLPQQLPGGSNYLPRADFKQAIIGPKYMAVISGAGGAAQHDTASTERTVARRISRPEDPDHWNPKRRRKMHGAGIAADEQTGATSERDQLGKRTSKWFGRAAAGSFHGTGEVFFSWTKIDQRFQTIFRQLLGHFSVAFGRPLLRSPTGARIEQSEFQRALRFQSAVTLLLGSGTVGKPAPRNFQPPLGNSLDERQILFHNMFATSDDLPCVKHGGQIFTRLGRPVDDRRSRPPRQQRRAHRTLKVEGGFISCRPQIAQAGCDPLPGRDGKGRGTPLPGVHGVDSVYQRTLRRTRAGARHGQSTQQFRPTFFDEPSQHRLGKCFSQRRHGGKTVNHVAQGAEAHDQPPIDLLFDNRRALRISGRGLGWR